MVEQDEEIVIKLEETDGGCYGARFAEQGKRQGKTMKRMSNWESCNMKLNFSYNCIPYLLDIYVPQKN